MIRARWRYLIDFGFGRISHFLGVNNLVILRRSDVGVPGFDSPTDAVEEHGKYGGRRQSRWLRTADGFAV